MLTVNNMNDAQKTATENFGVFKASLISKKSMVQLPVHKSKPNSLYHALGHTKQQ